MSPEIKLPEKDAARLLLGKRCAEPCKGRLQVHDRVEEVEVFCLGCRKRVNLATARLSFEWEAEPGAAGERPGYGRGERGE